MTFEEIIKKPQPALKKALTAELMRLGYRTKTKHGFIYAKGTIPVLLVAHLDTVHREPVKTICYSHDGTVLMSPQGIGGDDRAGVYMILEIIKRHRCHVLFCEDEEVGGIGAAKFAESAIYPKINYIVELDRRGEDDAVFYDCDNPDFTKFVTRFGFIEDFGSFSDISIIAPALGAAAVNISAGYYNEHTLHECVDMGAVKKNIERVGKMVAASSGKFVYMEAMRFRRGGMFDWFDHSKRCSRANSQKLSLLMPLPESAYIKLPNGELRESDMQDLIDENGKVYEFLFDFGVAVVAHDHVALTENGLPVKFRLEYSEYVEVVPMEHVMEAVYGEAWEDEVEQYYL